MRDVNERNRLLYSMAQRSDAIKKQITTEYNKEREEIDSLEIDEEEKKEKLITLQSNYQNSVKIIQEYENFSDIETGRMFFTVDEVLVQVFEKLYQEMGIFRRQLSADLGIIANELKDIKKKLIKK